MATRRASSRSEFITAADNGNFLEFGPAGTSSSVGTFVFQFQPSMDFAGSIQVMGKCFGPAAQAGNAATIPIPYRRVNVAGAASDYAIVADAITSAGIIQVPSNGITVTFLVTCTAGSCGVFSWDLQGPSSI